MQNQDSNYSVFSFALMCAREHFGYVCALFCGSIVWAAGLSLRPYVLKVLLDAMGQGVISKAGWFALALWSTDLFMGLISRFFDWTWLHLGPNMRRFILHLFMDRMLGHSHALYQSAYSGSLANRVIDVMNGTPELLRIFLDQFFAHSMVFVFGMYTISTVQWKFAIGLFVLVALFLSYGLYVARNIGELASNSARKRANLLGVTVDILSNMMNIRLFCNEESEVKVTDQTMASLNKTDQSRYWYLIKVYIVQVGMCMMFQALCLFWLINGLKYGVMTAGDCALVLTLNLSVIDCLWLITRDIQKFGEFFGTIKQSLKLINMTPAVLDIADAKILEVSQGKIVFDQVSFHYQENRALFENQSLEILPKQKIGLVGCSGSGKTSFINLILRVYDVDKGRILIDDQDISQVTQQSLRNSIAVINQDTVLFNRSLLDNVAYGLTDATCDDVLEACKAANAHEFIMHMPQAYNSMVGERGMKLSGGQRQRIAIARAFLKEAPILILDEPTSQLDPLTEQHISKSLNELMENKTCIVIAHRLETLKHMDRILVFERGKIVQDGSHEQLVQQNGLYQRLWHTQSQGFLHEEQAN